MIKFKLTSKIPKVSGHYIYKKNGCLNIMFISKKDLEVTDQESYLGDCLWSTESIIEVD
jgi:hypothetical protein